MAYGARLESVLGASSRGFESRILRGYFGFLAVAVGFEPTENFRPHTLSRRAPLAARTRHRVNRTVGINLLFFWIETASIL